MTDWTPNADRNPDADPELPQPFAVPTELPDHEPPSNNYTDASVYDGPTTEEWQPRLTPPTAAAPPTATETVGSFVASSPPPPAMPGTASPAVPPPTPMPSEPPVLGDTGAIGYPAAAPVESAQPLPLGPPVIDDRPAPPYASTSGYGPDNGMPTADTRRMPPIGAAPESATTTESRPRRGRRLVMAAAALFGALFLFGGGFAIGQVIRSDDSPVEEAIDRVEPAIAVDEDLDQPPTSTLASPTQTVPIQTNAPEIDSDIEPVAAVAQAVGPAVVQIETNFGVGSGFVYSEEGHILTAAHVVEDATRVTVRLQNGAVVEASLIGTASDADVAVVKIDPVADMAIASLAIDYTPQVGQLAVAIGSPFGLDQTVTAGIVSAVNRSMLPQNIIPLVQTDAAINSGNSGGALVDREGRVIGINVSIQTTSGGNQGVGFAVPIDIAFKIAERLVVGDDIIWPLLGVGPSTSLVPGQDGAVVGTVSDNSGASEAGLRPGDRIVAVDGVEIVSFGELRSSVLLRTPGSDVELDIIREGEDLTLTATLGQAEN